ncbi:MAG: DUF373 family protein [Candidatus Thermoplasmatota archaeon]|nr:DUF373 family protein [Candidatus Thermoplasmatota archaeon]
MASVLILCVDRDNDFGVKTGVSTPIIGRDANLDAAMGLGLADPEDTDTNALLAGINVYDDLVRQGHEADIATICGHRNVGSTSDRILAKQLDEVLTALEPSSCILVTDGAEDEFILPLITSRTRVDAVKRVIVRQNQDIEGVYYVIKRALEDEKIQRTFFVPVAIALLIYGLAAITGYQSVGLGAISLAVGGWFIVKGFQMEEAIGKLLADFYEGLLSGRITLFTSFFSIAILLGGIVFSWQDVTSLGPRATPLGKAIRFVASLVWWAVGAAMLVATGRVADTWVKERKVLWGYWPLPFSMVAIGLGLTALLHVAARIEGNVPTGQLIKMPDFLTLLAAAVIGFLGWTTHHYVQRRVERKRALEAPTPPPASSQETTNGDGPAQPPRTSGDGEATDPASQAEAKASSGEKAQPAAGDEAQA